MVRSNFGAVRLPLLGAAVLASFAASLSAQVVEKGRTYADLVSSHPCNSGNSGRLARVTDAQSSSSIGGGGGSVQVWAVCNGVDTWTLTSIGSAGGGAATAVTGSATLPATCTEKDLYQDTDSGGTEFYVCTATNTWTKAGTGTIGGSTGATDNAILRADGVGGVTAQSSPVTIDDTTGVLTAPQVWKHTTVGGATYTADYGGPGRHIWSSANGSGYQFYIAGTYIAIDSAYALGWTTNITGGGNDAGFARSAAGVVKVTDGFTGIRGFLGGGAAVASATALPLPTGRVFHVTGTTDIKSITSTNFQSGVCVTLIFDGVLNFTDGSNLKLASTMATTADDTISLCYDGTSWFETSRSVN